MSAVYPTLTKRQIELLRKMHELDAADLAAAETIRKEKAPRPAPATMLGNRAARRRTAATERRAARRRKA